MDVRRLRSWKEILGETEGAEIAEAAVILPILLTILLGIFWFGRAYNIYATITHAANEGARVAATPLCATCSAATCGSTTSSFPCDSSVVDVISATLRASKLDPGRIVAVPDPTSTLTFCTNLPTAGACNLDSTSNVYVCRGVRLSALGNPVQECGSLVTFKYPYQFYLPFTSLNMQLVSMQASAEVRMEY